MSKIDLHVAAFKAIAEAIRVAIKSGSLPVGLVLLEGPLAQVFNTSRSPVRQALSVLQEEGIVHSFDGRGLVAGPPGCVIRREPIRAEMFAFSPQAAIRAPLWRRVFNTVERDLMYASIFEPGSSINESEMASFYSIGRSTVGHVLNRAEVNGMVARDTMGRWSVVGLDEKRLERLYQLRIMLEPEAIENVACAATRSEFTEMMDRLKFAAERYPDITAQQLNQLELDLHLDCIDILKNAEVVRALLHTGCTMIVRKYTWIDALSLSHDKLFMTEHMTVFQALLRGNGEQAKRAMTDHLSADLERLKAHLSDIRTVKKKVSLSYLQRRA
ncbi:MULTISPECIES: GntR family transcriptional regulator [unclassified Shinella]|uniref:GntR family transcriptional regulator n=1 Tax=unclassified Shinella TaxID=2643062 RepID=UPI00234ECB47|nr:GntR family transcriptional regulator [Shinella sp. YE25]MDC7260119.1 GntR family transcriptional regulator [Shinella sp. YE25]